MKKISRPILSLILIGCLLFSSLACSQEGGKQKDYKVSQDQPLVETREGLVLDFGLYNELDEEKLSIVKSQEDDEIMGGKLDIYDIELEETSSFDDLVHISLPYDASNTIEGDEENSVLVQYWDEKDQEWTIVPSQVDTKEKTVSFNTDHFSRYCVVTINDPDTPYARIARISNLQMMKSDKASAIFEEFSQLGYAGPLALEEGLAIAGDLVGLGDNLLTMATFEPAASIFGSGLGGLPLLDKVSSLSSKAGLSLAVIQLASDIQKGDPRETSVNAYRNVISNSLSYYGTSAIRFSMLGVMAIDYSLNTFSHAAKKQYEDDIYRYVAHYNNSYSPRSGVTWYKEILKLYQDNQDNPEKLNDDIEKIMYDFSKRFFDLSYDDQMLVVGDLGGKLPFINDEVRQKSIDRYMMELGESLQSVFLRVQIKINQDIKEEYFNYIHDLRRTLNTTTKLQISENLPEDGESFFANHSLALVKESHDPVNSDWIIQLDEKGSGSLDITTLGYLQAGAPQFIDIYKDLDGEAVRSLDFILEDPLTEIVLEGALPSFDELLGDYAEARRTIASVFISDKLRDYLNEPDESSGESSGEKKPMHFSAEDLGLEGCDFKEIILGFEEQVGAVEEDNVSISKTGENQGLMSLDMGELNLVYDPASGILSASASESLDEGGELELFSGEIQASFGQDMKEIILDGTLYSSLFFDPEDFVMELDIWARKP